VHFELMALWTLGTPFAYVVIAFRLASVVSLIDIHSTSARVAFKTRPKRHISIASGFMLKHSSKSVILSATKSSIKVVLLLTVYA